MKIIFFISVLFCTIVSAQILQETDRKNILKALEDQRITWNDGNLEGYMQGYWKSDSLRFIGKRGVQYGWNATLENYRKGYPDKAAMGNLTFKVISIESLGNNSAFMIGKWKLDYPDKSIDGHFTLLYKKINGKWLVVADHSS
jgi:ketosteroid isomerase-like protein